MGFPKLMLAVLSVLFTAPPVLGNASTVSEITPRIGSLVGGTRIDIYGTNFASDLFNYGPGNEDKGNKVWLRSTTKAVQCDVIAYYTNEKQIVCDTRAVGEEGVYDLYIEVDGQDMTATGGQYCRNVNKCRFEFRNYRTPNTQSVTPRAAPPGSVLTVRGKLTTAYYQSTQIEEELIGDSTTSRQILRSFWGGSVCDLVNEDGDVHGIALDNDGASQYGEMQCIPKGSTIGSHQNVYLISADWGRSMSLTDSLLVSGKNELYHHQSHAVVYDVSPKEGSIAGGLLVTVTGNHFTSNSAVLIGGQPCEVVNVSKTEILCITSPATDDLPSYPGNRGMRREVWPNTYISNVDDVVFDRNASDYNFEFVDDAASSGSTFGETNYYNARLVGFFRPPRDNYYRFHVVCDDRSILYLSKSVNESEKEEIARCPSHGYNYFEYEEATSEKIYLEGGSYYYMEATLVEYSGQDYVYIGFTMYDVPYTSTQISTAVTEKQNIHISSTVTLETQMIIVNGNVNELQMLLVNYTYESANSTNCSYTLSYSGQATDKISCGADAEEVENALTSLSGLQDVIVELVFFYQNITYLENNASLTSNSSLTNNASLTSNSSLTNNASLTSNNSIVNNASEGEMFEAFESYAFLINFPSDLGNVPSLSAVSNDSDVSLEVREEQDGISPITDEFVLVLDGVESAPLSAESTADEVEDAIIEMLTVQCVRASGASSLYYEDFETDVAVESGSLTKADIPYCGRTSWKNPEYIYAEESSIRIQPYKGLCFAVRGKVSGALIVYTHWFDQYLELHYDSVTLELGSTSVDSWTHKCFDLETELLEVLTPQGLSTRYPVTFDKIQIPSYGDYFVDNIFVGTSYDSYDRLADAARPNGILILDVTVEKMGENNSTFNVTFTPADCGYGFPLIGVKNTAVVSGSADSSSDGVVYRNESWPTNATLMVERAQFASPPLGGFFNISHQGFSASDIPVTASVSQLKYLLEAYLDVGDISVTKTSTCHEASWDVEWVSFGGSQPMLEVDDSSVTGNLVETTVTEVREGSVFMGPIPGEFLRTLHFERQTEVVVNDIPSRCDGNCSFAYSLTSTPTLEGVYPTSGSECETTSITLTGSGFSLSEDENNVTIGDAPCYITSANSTSLTCDVTNTQTGVYNVSVVVEGKGLADLTNGAVEFTYNLVVTTFSPQNGSTAGGTEITIEGCGFSDVLEENTPKFGSRDCIVTYASHDTLICSIEMDINESRKRRGSDIQLSLNVIDISVTTEDIFSFQSSLTPEVTSFSPTNSSVLGGERLTILGSGFKNSSAVVTINGEECTISLQNETIIVCEIPPNEPGQFPLLIHIDGKGYAEVDSVPDFTYAFDVYGMLPTRGSINGGTLVTLIGSGFGDDVDTISITLGEKQCEIESVDNDTLEFWTPGGGVLHEVTNQGRHENYGVGYKWDPQALKISVGDTVRWQWAVPDYVVGIQYTVFQTAEDSTSYDGSGFHAGSASASGFFSKQFQEAGTYYYSSGPVDGQGIIVMTGIINVLSAAGRAEELVVSIGNYTAAHNTDYSISSSSDPCSIETTYNCSESAEVSGEDSSKFYFLFNDCSTPVVTDLSPIYGTTDQVIEIVGNGFGPVACQNSVSFGGHLCDVLTANETYITCQLDISTEPVVNVWQELDLTVVNRGDALVTIQSQAARSYTVLPQILVYSHNMSSSEGGLPILIEGSGFSADSASGISVEIGSSVCNVTAYNYTHIFCTTGPNSNNVYYLVVEVDGVDALCMSDCLFEYSSDLAVLVTDVYPSDSFQGELTTFRFEGIDFPTDPDELTILIGSVNCDITTLTNSNATACEITYVPAGEHEIIFRIADQGQVSFTSHSGSITSTSYIERISPNEGSIEGGQYISFYGSGFHVDNMQILINSQECDIVFMNISYMECVTPANSAGTYTPIVTADSLSGTFTELDYVYSSAATPTVSGVSPSSGVSMDTITISGTGFGMTVGDIDVVIDGVACVIANVSDSTIECVVGEHSAGVYVIEVTVSGKGKATSDTDFEYELAVYSTSPDEGSFGGGTVLAIDGVGFDNITTSISVCDGNCTILSINSTIITCETPANSGDGSTETCDVIVSLTSGSSFTTSSAFTYKTSLTPYITSVEPTRGGTGGGTTVNITGTSFASSGNLVTIAGTECTIISESETEILCRSGAHSQSERTKVRVEVGSQGIAVQDNADYFYIDVWSSIYTWGGNSPPAEGEFVVIPPGQTILLDETTPVLKMLLIQGGHVVFDEVDLELHSEYIVITDAGSLTVGTEDAHFEHEATIMLHGHTRSQELPLFGAKVLAVRNGTLDLHGQFVPITWTHLAETINAGDTSMTLMKSVTWRVGDRIVIASTGHRHAQRENEELVITGISADGMSLNFTPPVDYKHISMEQTINGVYLETRAEVGLLSHNVKVRGSVHDEWTETIEACSAQFDTTPYSKNRYSQNEISANQYSKNKNSANRYSNIRYSKHRPYQFATQTCFQGRFGEETGSDQYGSHIMLFAKEMDKDWIVGRISYVEVTHAGQAFRLGRYPIHFHMSGDITGSYVRGCGISHTFNRAVTIHGVHKFLVEHNVAYNIMGHAYFMEDGIETQNTVQYNLAVFVRPSSSLLNVDITPAAFWVTNPDNIMRHNSAAGGSHFGFWYNMPSNPGGPSYDPNIFPRNVPLGKFYNNTVHTQGWYGIWIFPIYYPSEPAKFYTLTAWNVERGAEAVEVGTVQFHQFLISDATASGLEFQTVAGPWGDEGPLINDSVVIGHSALNANDSSFCTGAGVQLPKSKFLTVDGVKFMNFDRSCVGIKACGHCKDKQGGFQSRFKNIEWYDSPNKASFKWEHECWLEDLDGTLTGEGANFKLLPSNPTLPKDYCSFGVDHSSSGSVNGSVCDDTVLLHRMAFNNAAPSSLKYKNTIFTNSEGTTVVPYKKKRLTHPEGWMLTLVDESSYTFSFEDVEHVTNISYNARFDDFEDGQYVYMTHNFYQEPDAASTVGTVWNGTDGIPDPVTSNHGDFTFDNATKDFTYIVSGIDRSSPGNLNINLNIYRCYYKDCIPPRPPSAPDSSAGRPADALLWSNANVWMKDDDGFWIATTEESDGSSGLPEMGADVKILPDVWLVADMQMPQVNKLFIYGTMEIDDTMDHQINATYIFIHGGRMVAGNATEPFQHKIHFLLEGDHFTPDIPLPNGPNMGSKVIGVFGSMDLHGMPRYPTWTQLAATVNPGDDTLTVAESTDWGPGDEIVVATTNYEAWQTETFMIEEAIDNSTFRLNGTFQFLHTVANQTISTGQSFTIAAEVGLLTRNIVIEGADYPEFFEESFGARVIVGQFFQDGELFIGDARITNVEFKHTGQDGWPDFFDPRYSLAFLDIGTSTPDKPSYVKSCSFHDGFNTAIGVFGSHELEVIDNVVHHALGPGIISWGEETRIIHNLVTLVVFPGTYQDRYEPENLVWNAGIEIESSRGTILINNTVAGSERVGFKTKGEVCDGDSEWFGNTAHSAIQGHHMLFASQPGCTKIANFLFYRNYDYGIYAQITSSLLVTDSIFADNAVNIFALIVGPAALSHQVSDKFVEVRDSLIVGQTDSFDCCDDTPTPENAGHSGKHRPPKSPSGGNVGFIFTTFASGGNGAVFKPMHGLKNYAAIGGISRLNGVTFANFDTYCDKKHVVFMTHPGSGDCMHPLEVQNLQFDNVDRGSLVFIHRPSLGWVNPSDCVDMDCDAHKKAIIRDLDGSLLGSIGTVIPDSAFEWDGDPRRGLGDYRIPKTLLTRPEDGSRIPVEDIAPYKGIIRDGNCSWISSWNSFECHGLDHMMMVIESMDADTEVRRISPVAVLSDGYLDLINGPMDHGWCHGYTCQERISTFYSIVDTGRNYTVYFTGTNPQQLRLHLLHSTVDQAVVVKIYYSNPQRLDVYHNGIYIMPTNGQIEDGVFTWKAPEPFETNADYYPALSSLVYGENYFDRDTDELLVLVRGPVFIEIKTTPVVMTTFGVPAVEVDNFFEENVVQNLANLLDVDPSKIRVVEIIAEDSARRKRRSAGEVEVVVEIGNPPSPTSGSTSTSNTTEATPTSVPEVEDALDFNDLLNIQSVIADEVGSGSLGDSVGYTVTYVSMTDPIDTPVDPTGGVRATNETGGPTNGTQTYAEAQAELLEESSSGSTAIEYRTPSALILHTQPSDAIESNPFGSQPLIKVVDAVGNLVEQLGHSSNPWQLQAVISDDGGSESAGVIGNTTISFQSGWFNFTNLAINVSGSSFVLDFIIVRPNTSSLSVTSDSFDVSIRPYTVEVINQPTSVNENEDFAVVLELQDEITGLVPENLEEMGYTWTATASLYNPSNYRGGLSGQLSMTFDLVTGRARFSNLSIDASGIKYAIQIDVETTPSSEYSFSATLDSFDVVDPDAETYTGEAVTLTIRFDADYNTVVNGNEEELEINFMNHIAPLYPNVTFSNIVISEGSILITFDIQGDTTAAQAAMWEDILDGDIVLTFNGYTLQADEYLLVEGEQYQKEGSPISSSFPVWAIIIVAFMMIVMCFIFVCLFFKLFLQKDSKISSSTEELPLHDKSEGSLQRSKGEIRSIHSPTIFLEGSPIDDDKQELLKQNWDAASIGNRSPRLNSPRRSPEVAVTSLPPGFADVQQEYNLEDREELSIMVKNQDGTFQRLGTVNVNMVGTIHDLRTELATTALPVKVREKPFVVMDEMLKDIESYRERHLVMSEVYTAECVLIRWVEDQDIQKLCVCGLVGQFDCSLCHKQSYCSPQCQSKDWPRHSLGCTIYSEKL